MITDSYVLLKCKPTEKKVMLPINRNSDTVLSYGKHKDEHKNK